MNNNALFMKLQLVLIMLFAGVFIFSCKKDRPTTEDSMTISQVETWFKQQTSGRQITTSLFRQSNGTPAISSIKPSIGMQTVTDIVRHSLILNWKNAKAYKTSDSTIFEVPIKSSGIFNFDIKAPIAGDKIPENKSSTRFLFIKTGTKMEGYFMTIISSDEYMADASSDPVKNTFLKKEVNFSGTIIYHDLQGNMTNAISINKKQLNKPAKSRYSNKGKISAAYPDQCKETPIYQVFGVGCYDIGNYIFCDSYYSVYVGQTICGGGGGSPGGSGGGSGGGSNSPISEVNFNSNLLYNGLGPKPLKEYNNKCEGLKDIWNSYPDKEVFGYVTADGKFLMTNVISFTGGEVSGVYQHGETIYYTFPDTNGPPSGTYAGMVHAGKNYFIPVVASVHTHSPCRTDGTNGVSHEVGPEDRSLASSYPKLRNFVIGCGSIAEFNSGSTFFNIRTGTLDNNCTYVK